MPIIFTRMIQKILEQQSKLFASDATGGDQFGYSSDMSSDGNTLALGTPFAGTYSDGAVYVFTRSGTVWTEEEIVLSTDIANNDYYGIDVALSADGDTMVVGAFRKNSYDGAVYIFTRSGTTWTQQQKLLPPNTSGSQNFGERVDISGDGNTLVVANTRTDVVGSDAGLAHVYVNGGSPVWTLQQSLFASDAQNYDLFGLDVSLNIDGNRLLVGATDEDTPSSNAGAAYIFTRSGTVWTEEQILHPASQLTEDQFGYSVSLSNDGLTAIIGSPYVGTNDEGAVYLFTRGSGSPIVWTEQQTIQAPITQTNGTFGWSVFLSGDGESLIVGAAGEPLGALSNVGAAYIFSRDGSSFVFSQKIQPAGATTDDYIGRTVTMDIDGNTAIIGAIGDDDEGTAAGAAYIFTK